MTRLEMAKEFFPPPFVVVEIHPRFSAADGYVIYRENSDGSRIEFFLPILKAEMDDLTALDRCKIDRSIVSEYLEQVG